MTRSENIIAAINAGNNRTRDIALATGISRHIVQVRLAELVRTRAVSAFRTIECPNHGNEKWYRVRGE